MIGVELTISKKFSCLRIGEINACVYALVCELMRIRIDISKRLFIHYRKFFKISSYNK